MIDQFIICTVNGPKNLCCLFIFVCYCHKIVHLVKGTFTVPFSKVLYNVHYISHSHINGRGNYPREQLGVQSHAQGHFDTNPRAVEDRTRNLLIPKWSLNFLRYYLKPYFLTKARNYRLKNMSAQEDGHT